MFLIFNFFLFSIVFSSGFAMECWDGDYWLLPPLEEALDGDSVGTALDETKLQAEPIKVPSGKVSKGTRIKKKCTECALDFTHLKLHLINAHNYPSDFYCQPCKKYFPFKSNLIQHNASKHSGESAFRCLELIKGKVCCKVLANVNELNRHKQNVHNINPNYFCKRCNKGFADLAVFKEHNGYVHCESGKLAGQYLCDRDGCSCGRYFITEKRRDRHRKGLITRR